MAKNYEGQPPLSCPVFDLAIKRLDDAIESIRTSAEMLEEARKINHQLRLWGEEHYDRANDAENRLEEALERAREATEEIAALKDRISETEGGLL